MCGLDTAGQPAGDDAGSSRAEQEQARLAAREAADLVEQLARVAGLQLVGKVVDDARCLLQQVAALSVPDRAPAVEVSRRVQRAIQAAMAADLRYREWLEALRGGCTPPTAARRLRATGQGDAQATAAKKAFLRIFNPLARRYGQRSWSAGSF